MLDVLTPLSDCRQESVERWNGDFGEPLNAGPSGIRICAGLHNASGTQPQKPKNTRKPKHEEPHEEPIAKDTQTQRLLLNNNINTQQGPSTKSSISVLEHRSMRAPEQSASTDER